MNMAISTPIIGSKKIECLASGFREKIKKTNDTKLINGFCVTDFAILMRKK